MLGCGAAPDIPKQGRTPLIAACLRDFVDVAKVLLEHGANANAADYSGTTPLIIAVKAFIQALVVELLRFKAAVRQANNDGDTPLQLGIKRHYKIIVALMRPHWRDIEVPRT